MDWLPGAPWAAHGLLGLAVALQSQPPAGEGELRNSSTLPVAAEAADWFARGDADFARLLERKAQGATGEDLDWVAVWEAWRRGVAESAPGAAIAPRPVSPETADNGIVSPFPDPEGTTDRRTIGVEEALLQRLELLSVAERQGWAERFGELARLELETAGRSAAALGEVERRNPATRAAVQATLQLSELALEQGRFAVAQRWLDRARRHLELLTDAEMARALALRERVLSTLAPAPADVDATGAWRSAKGLTAQATIALPEPAQLAPYRGLERRHPGEGVQPGVVFPTAGLAVAQLPGGLLWLDLERAQPLSAFVLQEVLAARGYEASPVLAAHNPPGWPLVPDTDGRALVAVHGRTEGRVSNALVCLDAVPSGGRPPEIRWVASANHVRRGTRRRENWPAGWGPDSEVIEYQPGPRIVGTQVLVQARTVGTGDGPQSSWILAFDLQSGAPRWARRLVDGVGLTRDLGRFARSATEWAPAQALVTAGAHVFAGTHLGAGALLDSADGRWIWGLRNRRREPNETTWAGWWPHFAPDASALLWSPADGDHLYWLRTGPRVRRSELFAAPPRAVRSGLAVVGGDADQALVLARSGARQTVSRWDADGGRTDALDLGPEEHLAGPAAVSAERVYCASERALYALDRSRELWLLDVQPIQPLARGRRAGPSGGGVYAHGKHVLVAGLQGFWLFRTR